MFTCCRNQYQRRVPITTFTLSARKHVIVFPVHIGSGGAILTVVIRSPVTSKLIARPCGHFHYRRHHHHLIACRVLGLLTFVGSIRRLRGRALPRFPHV